MNSEVVGKSLELLKEVVPKLSRVAVVWNPANAIFQRQMLQEAERAAGVLGLQLRKFGVRSADELDPAFAAVLEQNADSLLVMADPTLIVHRARIVDFAAAHGLPAVYGTKINVESGGLMSYGPDMSSQFYRAAAYVDKILKGAKPADLPVEQATKFELVINMKTVKSLGITIPLPLLGRADEVIE